MPKGHGPFRSVLIIFLRAIYPIVKRLHAKSGDALVTLAQRVCLGFAVYSTNRTKAYWLETAMNKPNPDAKPVHNHPNIPYDRLTDPKIQKIFFNSINEVCFDGSRGICRGMTMWFGALYFKTKNLFTDQRQHMMALTSLYRNGGTPQATLAQALDLHKDPELIGLKFPTYNYQNLWKADLEFNLVRKNSILVPQDIDDFKQKMHDLKNGFYKVFHDRHATVFLK